MLFVFFIAACVTVWQDPDSSLILAMVLIPHGSFTMGSPEDEPGRRTDAGYLETQHSVTISGSFYMGKYPVTQEQYEAVMGANPSDFHGGEGREAHGTEVQGKRPVERVNWYHAIAFCNRLSIVQKLTPMYTIEGMSNTDADAWLHSAVPTDADDDWNAVTADWDANGYRLPTEAEWEYACRAKTTTAFYCGTAAYTQLEDYAGVADALGWHGGNSGDGIDPASRGTHQVGLKLPNAWGLYDMHGNVYEWCWGLHEAYTATAKTDPRGAASSTHRVIRGGSWFHGAQILRSAYRNSALPTNRSDVLSFRVARNAR